MFAVGSDCVTCGLCSRVCVSGIIKVGPDKRPFVAEGDEKKCLRCGQCVAFCPKGCCSLSFQTGPRVAVDWSKFPDPASAETLLRSRRSVRNFKKTPVSMETVSRLLETARYAPTASNRQPVRWVIVMTREKLEEIGGLTARALKSGATGRKWDEWVGAEWEKGHDVIFRGAPQLAAAIVPNTVTEDGAIALAHFELAAHALGVGCCWAGIFNRVARKSPEVLASIGVKEDELLAGSIMFGNPDVPRARLLPERNPVNVTWLITPTSPTPPRAAS
ncbi:MAG: nitroreductase family protein [Synergistaceae bacterium]|nr:nitroreductase family protein [Synergistaceae bacterium]